MVLKVLRDWIEVGAIKFQAKSEGKTVFLGSAFERRFKHWGRRCKGSGSSYAFARRAMNWRMCVRHGAALMVSSRVVLKSESSAISELGSLYHFLPVVDIRFCAG